MIDFQCDLSLLKAPLFHIILRSLSKKKLSALYQHNHLYSDVGVICVHFERDQTIYRLSDLVELKSQLMISSGVQCDSIQGRR